MEGASTDAITTTSAAFAVAWGGRRKEIGAWRACKEFQSHRIPPVEETTSI